MRGTTGIRPLGSCAPYKYVVSFARYEGKWLFARHKERTTWETAGGHVEPGETPMEAAKRELYEENGALRARITPVCDYISGGATGMVFLAEIDELGPIPESEMAEVRLFGGLPENLTYPAITPVLYKYLTEGGDFDMLKVAMISKWHVHARGYAKFVQDQPDAQITCVWDEDAARGQEWAEELGVPFVADYDELLMRDDVDAVLIDTPTNMHKEVMVKAAKAKKHIFTEKCMCLTVADCDEVIKAVEENGVKFAISYPQRCQGRNLFIKNAIESGALGDVTLLRVRNCHNGALAGWLPDYWYDPETTGGGAMMDLGAHPMYLARWMLGKPTRIQSMFNDRTGHPVEDNSVCTIEFENKAIAISETSLVSPMTPAILEVYGTKGVVMAVDKDIRIKTEESNKYVEGGWIVPKLPEDLPHPIRQFIDGVLYGKEILFGLTEGRELTELMEKAYIAHNEKREVAF
ncbi:MAG: Gfo/Idh/MocA family oxidoreductase [Clostridia bacterium]|nr:Gfo/Idh/MocA family oxidoreductase [Clostridia bacterium]